jgi:precorrin-6B methylase 1
MAQTLADISSTKDAGIYVCERLGYPEERVVHGTAEEIASQSFAEPNVMIVKKV